MFPGCETANDILKATQKSALQINFQLQRQEKYTLNITFSISLTKYVV